MVTILACISSALFTISAFAASHSTDPFNVPSQIGNGTWYLYYTNTSGNRDYVSGVWSRSNNSETITRPSNFASGNPCSLVISYNVGNYQRYYGCQIYDTSFTTINGSTLNIVFHDFNNNLDYVPNDFYWSHNSYTSFSVVSNYWNLQNYGSNIFNTMIFTFPIYHRQGDGGTNLTSNDFPLTFSVNGAVMTSDPTGVITSSGNGTLLSNQISSQLGGIENTTTNTNTTVNNINNTTTNTNNTVNQIDSTTTNTNNTVNSISSDTQQILDNQDSISDQISQLSETLLGGLEWLIYNMTNTVNNLSTGSVWYDSYENSHVYAEYQQIAFSLLNEHVEMTYTNKAGTFLGILVRKFNELFDFFKFQFEIFFQWFYPLKSSTPQYWWVYDTDTDGEKVVNPATVTYYITWYLGQLYSQNYTDENGALNSLSNAVQNFATQAQQFEAQEHAVVNSVKSRLETFNPDIGSWSGFRAIGWCSNYLQQVWVNLGTYGTVISIALLLGVCLQFIGYFRYK